MKALTKVFAILALSLAVLNTASAGKALSWNLSRDMATGIKTNPKGVWAFMKNGYANHNPANYALLSNYQNPCLWGGVAQPTTACWENDNTTMIVGITSPSSPVGAYIPILHPNYAEGYAIVRWTSPITGLINIYGKFSLLDNGGVTGIKWYIDKDTTTLVQGSLTTLLEGNIFSRQNVSIQKGQSLYFIVDSNGSEYYDSTGLELLITSQK